MTVDFSGKIRQIGKFLYNKDKKSVLGRTAKSWGCISLFFLTYYAVLAGVFASLLAIFLATCITEKMPYLTGEHSLIRNSPGLTIAMHQKADHAFYHFIISDAVKSSGVITSQEELLNSYTNNSLAVNCSVENADFPNKPCLFKTATLGDCVNPSTALEDEKPCIYLKLNKVFGWLPEIENITLSPNGLVSCSGKNEIDDFILGRPVYYPSVFLNNKAYATISNLQFPYLNQKGYQTPIVALTFPKLTKNVLVMVKCKVDNLKNSMGEVSFEMSVDT